MQLFVNIALVALTLFPAGGVSIFIPAYAKSGDWVQDNYIVVLKDDIAEDNFVSHREWVTHRHHEALAKRGGLGLEGLRKTFQMRRLKAYAGSFDSETIAEIAARPEVDFIERDTVVTIQELVSQNDAPWGLARLSHRTRGSNAYVYDSSAGAGVTAYVIDTGVLVSHSQFGGRAVWGHTSASGQATNTDRHGHGTHVAGTIAGSTYGIAKKASIVAVKVLNDRGSGSASNVIDGIEWVVNNARGKKAVANMSLGGSFSTALNRAVESGISAGITFVVAAGNSNRNAANYSPASAPGAITVGSTTETDVRSSFSNYGSNLDIFAPGSNILSSYIGSNTATKVSSGTSMASPHVAGVCAYLLGLDATLTSPAAVRARLLELAGDGVVTSVGRGSPNKLLYNGSGQ